MNLKERINAFSLLGNHLQTLSTSQFIPLIQEAERENPWFTPKNIKLSIQSIINFLDPETLEKWITNYALTPHKNKIIGVIMAGNIPLVGFHDWLSVLISGHTLRAKLSSKDAVLLPHITNMLLSLEPRFTEKVSFKKRLSHCDAIIATGSNNTSRYFKSYFKNIPHIIRKSRSSCAVLTGEETTVELYKLGEDISHYFGLGCRSVSKLYLPKNYSLVSQLKQWKACGHLTDNHKYKHNYNYQKALLLTNKTPFFDTGDMLFVESDQLGAPVSVVYYEFYQDQRDLAYKINAYKNELQCIVTHSALFPQRIAFGDAQFPKVWEYADGVDTLAFISSLP